MQNKNLELKDLFFYGFRFEPYNYLYDGHWMFTWSLTLEPVGLVEMHASWHGHPH